MELDEFKPIPINKMDIVWNEFNYYDAAHGSGDISNFWGIQHLVDI